MTSDEMLYHYTSGIGLAGIAGTGKIWASSIHSLNDAAEFRYALDIARNYLVKERIGAEKESDLSEIFEYYLKVLLSYDIYVTSFCMRRDALSLWRCYCPAGFGYSLGIQMKKLEKVASQNNMKLLKCMYEPDEHHAIIQKWADEAIDSLKKSAPENVPPAIHARIPSTWNINGLVEIATQIKHPSFIDEQEWRLVSDVSVNGKSIKYRAAKTYLVPYFEVDLDIHNSATISELWMGPTPSADAALHSAERIARQLSVDAVSISKSPYREW